MEHKGYLTETGRLVQRIKRPRDPGHDAAGIRWSNDTLFETIVAEVWKHQSGLRGSAPIWIVRPFPTQGPEHDVRASSRRNAIAAFMEGR